MTSRELSLWRLSSQQILRPALHHPRDVVLRLGAVQAQDFAGALWSLGLRTPGAMVADVRKAIETGSIVRTWLLRGTLHFAAPEDIRWILRLVGPRRIAGSAGRTRQLGLTEDDFARCRVLLTGELRGGMQLTRQEIFGLLAKNGISPEGQRGYHLLWRAGIEGLICFGPHRGNQPTFVLLDEWVPEESAAPEGNAAALLAMRYFAGHGPATLQDFAWWSGLKIADAKAGMNEAGLVPADPLKGPPALFIPRGVPGIPAEDPPAYLLPGFDEYILGYRDRVAMLDPAVAGRTVIGTNGMMLPTVILGGFVVGTWKRTMGKKEITITVRPFLPVSPQGRTMVATAAKRYGKFLGLPVRIAW
jgi:hypothetical protein